VGRRVNIRNNAIRPRYINIDEAQILGQKDVVIVAIDIAPSGHGVVAHLRWPNGLTSDRRPSGGIEGPYPVEEALDRADTLREALGLTGVCVNLEPGIDWHPSWGELVSDQD
jgi:hypothetical protein